ncbi:uncharacterized protein H6S33_010395 [Morchella sextelata]|uniref:uncharacterized protein n=1 Tax=Morchella sextelata TaxID=1174677 RepID=UPI001D057841|nr:uncharacterized protein H6S33_010395 [Morchella sextelata]KAH0612343.1 hypothetical protein H6S33_010395 [Morchella sextelata]
MPKVIVVGAGWFGLIAAKTYLHIHPNDSLLILESASQLGGTWSRERIYGGMITHNAIGALEISDCPLENGTPTAESYIIGRDVTNYLYHLATKYSLHDRIQCDSPVNSIDRDPLTKEWILNIVRADGSEAEQRCEKLIMATGLTSKPFTPTDIPVNSPRIPLIHCTDLGKSQDFLESAVVNHVTIYGGSKSAFDAAYMCAAAGKKVDWIIRTTGQGVASMFTAKSLGQPSALLAPKRFFNAMSPCVYNRNTRVSRFLHGTSFGRAIIRTYWRTFTKILYKKQGLNTSENGLKLKPSLGELGPFWSGSTPTGVLSQVDFWDYVHPQNAPITVHRAEIDSINGGIVKLSDGVELKPDAHVWATGWIRNSSPLARNITMGLYTGVPLPLPQIPAPAKEHWDKLEGSADSLVLSTFPILGSPPPYNRLQRTHSPYRLYRLIAPPEMACRSDYALIHVGMVHTSATGMMAELQALWGVAYLDGKLDLVEKKEEMDMECAQANMWARRRYMNLGEKCANLTFEFLPYFDTLLGDLGLNFERKGGGWREWFSTYTPADYKGVLEEYMEKHEGMGVKDKSI